MSEPNFIESYLDFYADTEVPTIFNRWSAISAIAAILGRQCWVDHGHNRIYPNQYVMLVGESGTRKSTAVSYMKKLLTDVGYKKFAAKKTSKEKFLEDLHDGMEKIYDIEDDILDVTKHRKGNWTGKPNPTMRELFGVERSGEPSECLIAADEFNIFLGHSNIEFIEILTDLWDYNGLYPGRTKTGKPILINDPTICIHGGNTQIGISMAFPPEVIGQGFFARLISVYSDATGRRVTFPKPPNQELRKVLLETLSRLKHTFKGGIPLEPYSMVALDDIYQEWKDLGDVRFKSYSSRRFTHLLKLCLCVAAAREKGTIDTQTVIYANSILHYTEHFMPKALGEFGKAIHSDVSAKILELLEKADAPLNSMEDIWPQVHRDLNSPAELVKILSGMKDAGKIQVTSSGGLLPRKEPPKFDQPYCKVNLLREYSENQAKQGMPI
jgi:hypothetical protein